MTALHTLLLGRMEGDDDVFSVPFRLGLRTKHLSKNLSYILLIKDLKGEEDNVIKEAQSIYANDVCPVCLERYFFSQVIVVFSSCDHWIHRKCFDLHLQFICPYDRRRLYGARDVHVIQGEAVGEENEEEDVALVRVEEEAAGNIHTECFKCRVLYQRDTTIVICWTCGTTVCSECSWGLVECPDPLCTETFLVEQTYMESEGGGGGHGGNSGGVPDYIEAVVDMGFSGDWPSEVPQPDESQPLPDAEEDYDFM